MPHKRGLFIILLGPNFGGCGVSGEMRTECDMEAHRIFMISFKNDSFI
jgi:hypothetical protein